MAENIDVLPYSLGGLLYTPAIKKGMDSKILNKEINGLKSIAFCLEDSIQDSAVEEAENQLIETLAEIKYGADGMDLPLIFVRVRTPKHLLKVSQKMLDAEVLPTGFIFPKFDVFNGERYVKTMSQLQISFGSKIYMMPILESKPVANLKNRVSMLEEIYDVLDDNSDIVMNVRVGGNDLSNLYGIRRSCTQTIYDVGVVRDILANVINVFGQKYVISGPPCL